jgi:hypothetical protein
LPDGRTLRTLHDAGHYAAALPKAAQERAEWQTAAEMLILAAQGQRPVMFADIAMRKALHAASLRQYRSHGASRPGRKGSFA